MKINKDTIFLYIASIILGILSAISTYWILGIEWYFLIFPFLSGIFFVFIIKGDKVYKYLKDLIVGSFIYSLVLGVNIAIVQLKISWTLIYDPGFYTILLIPIFIFWLGGGLGIVFKGFYSLYKKIIDKVIIFIIPAIITGLSFFVRDIAIKGTIMRRYYGWPRPFLEFQIKDVIDGFLISKWSFFIKSLIYDYLILLALFTFIFFIIQTLNKYTKKLKLNPTPIIFILALLASTILLISPGLKKTYVERKIDKANYCQEVSDCQLLEPKCPFGCAIYVNKENAGRINGLLMNYDSNCIYSCIETKPSCVDNKCRTVIERRDALSFEIKSIKFSANTPEIITQDLMKNLNQSSMLFDFSKQTKSSLWWISDDGWNIIDKTALTIASSGTTLDKNHSFASPVAKKLNEQISKIFLDNDFKQNYNNSSKSETDTSFYDYVLAFEKNDTRCILKINGDDGKYSITCADNFWQAYNEQISYLKGLNIKDGVIYGIKRLGSFAKLDIAHRRTGHFKIIKIDGDKMKEIFAGQEYPSCELMDKYSVPKEIYENCYLDKEYYNIRF